MCAAADDDADDDGDDADTDADTDDDIDAFDAFDAIIQVVVILLMDPGRTPCNQPLARPRPPTYPPANMQARISMTSHHSNQLTQPLTCKNIMCLTSKAFYLVHAIMYTGLTGKTRSSSLISGHHFPSLVLRWCLRDLKKKAT